MPARCSSSCAEVFDHLRCLRIETRASLRELVVFSASFDARQRRSPKMRRAIGVGTHTHGLDHAVGTNRIASSSNARKFAEAIPRLVRVLLNQSN